MQDVSYDRVVERLLNMIPDIRPVYEAELKCWAPDTPGPHIVYGDLFCDLVRSLYEERAGPGARNVRDTLGKVFRLLEELSCSSDREVRWLVEVSVLETLLDEPDGLCRYAALLGPETLRLALGLIEERGWDPEGVDLRRLRIEVDGPRMRGHHGPHGGSE